MYGYFVPGSRRLRIWQEEVLGMPLLRFEMPEIAKHRTVKKLERFFGRWRVHRVLNTPQSWPGGSLPPLSETRSLWMAKAPEVTLALLEGQGISPAAAAVEFFGDRFPPQGRRILLSLLPRVRTISLNVPVEEGFLWLLQREYGLSPLGIRGDVAICFSPAARPLLLPLWQERPTAAGLTLTAPELQLPDGCPELPLLAALAEQGRLGQGQIRIRSDFS